MIAVILAGGSVDGDLRFALGHELKALGVVGGLSLLDRTIEAARGSGAARIVVIGDEPVKAASGHLVDEVVPTAGDGTANVARALELASETPMTLFASDMPFIAAQSVERFLEQAKILKAEIAIPLATAARYDAVYPGAPPHITDVGGEKIANGSVFYFSKPAGPQVLKMAQSLFDARKSLTQMAMLLGPALALKYAAKRLRIDDIEARALNKFGVRARAVRDCAPDLCYDVDEYEDYAYAARLYGSRAR